MEDIYTCAASTCHYRWKWLPVVTCGYLWLPVVTCGYLWLPVVTCGYLWLEPGRLLLPLIQPHPQEIRFLL